MHTHHRGGLWEQNLDLEDRVRYGELSNLFYIKTFSKDGNECLPDECNLYNLEVWVKRYIFWLTASIQTNQIELTYIKLRYWRTSSYNIQWFKGGDGGNLTFVSSKNPIQEILLFKSAER